MKGQEVRSMEQIRLRLSTLLALIGLMLLPFAGHYVTPLWIPDRGAPFHRLGEVFYFELAPQLLLAALVFAVIVGSRQLSRKQWAGLFQSLFEVAICISGILLAPTY
jgi:NADH:ubiquinone oxidoreductase subunit 6 (subunit J)